MSRPARPGRPFLDGVASVLDIFGVCRPRRRPKRTFACNPRIDYMKILGDWQRLNQDAARATRHLSVMSPPSNEVNQ